MKKALLLMAIFAMVSSCGGSEDEPLAPVSPDKNIKLEQTEYSIGAGESINIKGSNLEGVKWVSDNEFVATVSGQTIKTVHPGTAKIRPASRAGEEISVTVKAPNDLYMPFEPILDPKFTIEDMKKKFGEPFSSGEDGGELFFNYVPNNGILMGFRFSPDKSKKYIGGTYVYPEPNFEKLVNTFNILYDFDSDASYVTSSYSAYIYTLWSGSLMDKKVEAAFCVSTVPSSASTPNAYISYSIEH